jgi:hypothetical protein
MVHCDMMYVICAMWAESKSMGKQQVSQPSANVKVER